MNFNVKEDQELCSQRLSKTIQRINFLNRKYFSEKIPERE